MDRPSKSSMITTRWVFAKKIQASSVVFKARLVARGCQQDSESFGEIYSPVAKWPTIRVFFAVSNFHDLSIFHVDVKCAFLNGVINEEIYIEIPECVEVDDSEKVCKLNKALYGLK